MNISEPESPWDEEQIGQLLTRFFQQEMPAEFRATAAPRPAAPRLATDRQSAIPTNSGSAAAILGLVVVCLGLMAMTMVQPAAPEAPADPVAQQPAKTDAAPNAATVQTLDNRPRSESAVNWLNPANSDMDSESPPDPLLQELDIQIFPLDESGRQGDTEQTPPAQRWKIGR